MLQLQNILFWDFLKTAVSVILVREPLEKGPHVKPR
jgi:hypothetical protein